MLVVAAPGERSERLVGRLEREPLALLGAQRRRTLDEHVPQRRDARGLRSQHVAREPAVSGPGLDDQEGIGLVERAPEPVERDRCTRAEERADLGTRDEVAPSPTRAVSRREEAALAVEGGFHEPVEGDRAFAVDQLRDACRGFAHTGNERSPTCAKSCG